MANVTTTLDTRRSKSDGTFNVIFRITHFKKVYTINSGISIQKLFWDSSHRKVNQEHPNSKHLNIKISKEFYKIEQAVLLLDDDFSIEKLRAMLNPGNSNVSPITFKDFSEDLIKQMLEVNRIGNAIVYQTAVNRFIAFSGVKITFDKIDYKLLMDFKHQLQVEGLKTNSISNYFRSLRAIYNQAIKQKLIDRNYYPFHQIRISYEKTAKRAISREQIKKLELLNLEGNSAARKSLDFFLLSFYLRGISFTDLAYLKPSNIVDGRLYYVRRKTGKDYSIKLFKQSLDILEKYADNHREYLLPVIPNDVVENSIVAKKIIQQWIKTTNKYLKSLGNRIKSKIPITTYTSRHAFGTIAKRLGHSNELIADALGHQYGNRVTNMYLSDFDNKVIDEMHYQIISTSK